RLSNPHAQIPAPRTLPRSYGRRLSGSSQIRMIFAPLRHMAHHDVVVIGASSGGVDALIKLMGRLPADFPAAVFVVLHTRPDAPSYLPAILNRAGRIPVSHAVDGEPIRRGRVYVAPPGNQTYVQAGRIRVVRGPRENLHRPAIDPLF